MDSLSIIIWVGVSSLVILAFIYFSRFSGVKKFVVDYTKTVEEIIVGDCSLEKVSPEINSKVFPMPQDKIGQTETLNGKIFSGKNLKELEKKIIEASYEVAGFYETLAFCTQHKSQQEFQTILAIASDDQIACCRVNYSMAHFGCSICKRQIYLAPVNDYEDGCFYALGVKTYH
ncbi:MAG: hypothetical protein WCK37_04815 [Candidatus Falkowbacteria bacterium]